MFMTWFICKRLARNPKILDYDHFKYEENFCVKR